MIDTKELPKNLEAEQSVVGAMALSAEAIEYAGSVLKRTDFYDERNAILFETIVSMHNIGIPTDAVTVAEQLEARGNLERVGGVEHMLAVLEAVPHAQHVRHYSDIVREKSQQRQLIYMCKETIDSAFKGDSADQLIGRVNSQVEELVSDSGKEIRSIEQVVASMKERDEEGVVYVPTGFDDLDEALGGGLRPRSLAIFAARPSMGKTSIGVQLVEAAAKSGKPALFVSAEMDAEDITERIPVDNLGEMIGLPILFEDQRYELQEIMNIIRLARRQKRIELVVIDYLQLIRVNTAQKSFEKLETITRAMKRLAKELRIPIVLLAQLNRKSEDREDSVPRLTDVKGGGSAEEDGDVVVLLHRPSYYDAKNRPGEADLMIEKNRHGKRKAVVKLGFEESKTRFVPYGERSLQCSDYFADEYEPEQKEMFA